MTNNTVVVGGELPKRKAKRSGLMKTLRQIRLSAFGMGLTAIRFVIYIVSLKFFNALLSRYGMVPGLIYFSIFHTEPQPTLRELLDPLF